MYLLSLIILLAAAPGLLHAAQSPDAATVYESCLTENWNQGAAAIAQKGDQLRAEHNLSTEEAVLASRLGTGGYSVLARAVTSACTKAFLKDTTLTLPQTERKAIAKRLNPMLDTEAKNLDTALLQACTDLRKPKSSLKISTPAARSKLLTACTQLRKNRK